MLTVTNWWPWCSKASVLSALQVGYRVHVIVSDDQNDPPAEPFLEALKIRFPGRVDYSRDSMRRRTAADHALTRYDYLPELLQHYQLPTLVTDADVIHRRPIRIPKGTTVGIRYQPPKPLDHVEQFSRHEGLPIIWGELALWAMIGAVYFAPTEVAFDFARRIRLFIEGLRECGLASKFGSDQLAVFVATRRLNRSQVHRFNESGCEDVCSTPSHRDHAIWVPNPNVDTKDEWAKAAETLAGEPVADKRFDF